MGAGVGDKAAHDAQARARVELFIERYQTELKAALARLVEVQGDGSLDGLRKVLYQYGGHLPACAVYMRPSGLLACAPTDMFECDCGWEQVCDAVLLPAVEAETGSTATLEVIHGHEG